MARAADTAAELSARSLAVMRDDVERVVSSAKALPKNPKKPSEAMLRAFQAWDAAVGQAASVIRDSDTLIVLLQIHADANEGDASDLLASARAARSQAFDVIHRLNPDQAWFWTQTWQRKEREADADCVADRTYGPMSSAEFLATLEAWDRELDATDRERDTSGVHIARRGDII